MINKMTKLCKNQKKNTKLKGWKENEENLKSNQKKKKDQQVRRKGKKEKKVKNNLLKMTFE